MDRDTSSQRLKLGSVRRVLSAEGADAADGQEVDRGGRKVGAVPAEWNAVLGSIGAGLPEEAFGIAMEPEEAVSATLLEWRMSRQRP